MPKERIVFLIKTSRHLLGIAPCSAVTCPSAAPVGQRGSILAVIALCLDLSNPVVHIYTRLPGGLPR